MKRASHQLLLLFFCLGLLTACNKKYDHSRYLPGDAMAIVRLHATALTQKMAWELLANGTVISMLTGKQWDTATLDIRQAGIDPLNDFYAYALPDQRLPNKVKIFLVLPLKDAQKFGTYVRTRYPEALVNSRSGLTLSSVSESIGLGWDKHTAIAVITAYPSSGGGYAPQNNTQSPSPTLLTEEIEKAFALNEKRSVSEHVLFATFKKEQHDLGFWLNYEQLALGLPQEEIGSAGAVLAAQQKLMKNAYLTANVNFEKGRITCDARYYFNPSMKAVLEALAPQSADYGLIRKIPGSRLNMMVSAHFNPQGIKTLIDTMSMLSLTQMALREAELNLDDLLKAFSGDFLFSISDPGGQPVNKVNHDDASGYEKNLAPGMNTVLSFGIGDKAAMDRLLQLAVTQKLLVPAPDRTYTLASWFSLAVQDNYISVSNDPAAALAFGTTVPRDRKDIPMEVQKAVFGIYADIQHVAKYPLLAAMAEGRDTALFKRQQNLIESLAGYGGEIKDGFSPYHLDIIFQNKEENSLLQLIHLYHGNRAAR